MVAWAIEWSKYDLEYCPCTAIKSQALANFIVECSFLTEPEEHETDKSFQTSGRHAWMLYVDGPPGKDRCGTGIILSIPEEFELK